MKKCFTTLTLRSLILSLTMTFILAVPMSLFAQIRVNGTVTDSEGLTLPGVTIQEKGTTNGTISDGNGQYNLQVSSDGILVFTFVGFETQEININNQSVIDVTMSTDLTELQEVVVIGYGVQQKKEITSAITSISADDFNRGNVNDPNQLLQGKVAGLSIARAGGDPNQPFAIRLRGLSTIGTNAQPLVVIDGVIGGSFDLLDPNDIASIEVLKDASAAAIYGTRGSSGVIIVTTKSGSQISDNRVDYNSYLSFESVSKTHPIASNSQFLDAGGSDFGSNTNWIEEITGTGVSNVHNIAVSGNSGTSSHRASINYRDIGSILNGRGLEQINGRLNLSQKLMDNKLTLSSIVSVTQRDADIGFSQALRYAMNFLPSAPILEDRSEADLGRDPNAFGGYFQTGAQDVFNPVAINEQNVRLRRTKGILMNFKADYEVFSGLNVAANYSLQSTSQLDGTYIANNSLWGRGSDGANNGIASRATSDNINELFELTSTYSGSTGSLNYNLLGGYSFQEFTFEEFGVTNTDFITNEVTFNNLGLGRGFNNPIGTRDVFSRKEVSRLIAFFGRANLNYNNALYMSMTYRREGSSKFGANNRWGNFWSLSGGVNVTEMVDLAFLDDLKVRAGYGVTGNPPVASNAYLAVLTRQGSGFIDGEFVSAIGPGSNPNPDLKWEEKGEFNIGIDFSAIDFRLSGTIDYFVRSTSDLLNTVSVPSPPNEFGTSLVNVGELETKGLEIQLNYNVINNEDFSWTISPNFSSFETKLVKWNLDEDVVLRRGNIGAPGLNNTFIARISEGDPIGQLVAPRFGGYATDGTVIYLDADGNEVGAIGDLDQTTDFVVAGNGIPDFNLGIGNTLTYNNFDLNFFLRGSFGHSLANINRAYFEHPNISGRQNIIITDFYNPNSVQTEAWHSEYVEDASFIRLDNATLGYTFNTRENSLIRNLRVYVGGQNLFTITDYSGADPEVRYFDPGSSTEGDRRDQFSGDILVPGIDRRVTYFPTRTWTVGLNVSF